MDYSAPRIALRFLMTWLSGLSLLSSCSNADIKLPYYSTPDFTPHFIKSEKELASQIKHVIPSFSFRDQQNKLITEKDIDGKVHVASFIFTSCGTICPKIINNLNTVKKAYHNNKEVVILSFSVTPWIDSVPRLRAFANNRHIDSTNWHLLTGSKADIYKLARQSYFAEEDLGYRRDSTEFLHTEHLVLVDRNRRIRGVYNGTLALEAEQLIKDIDLLLKEHD